MGVCGQKGAGVGRKPAYEQKQKLSPSCNRSNGSGGNAATGRQVAAAFEGLLARPIPGSRLSDLGAVALLERKQEQGRRHDRHANEQACR